jgi:hypothetical protein
MRNHQILCVGAKFVDLPYTDSIERIMYYCCTVHCIYMKNMVYGSKQQGENTVGTIFSEYAQALEESVWAMGTLR